MTINKIDTARVEAAVAKALHAHWRLFLFEGLVLLVLGLLAIVLPRIATVAIELLLGWLLLISGVIGLITTLRIAAGLILLWGPLSGAITMALILTLFFLLEGIASILYALDHRRELSGRWGWMLFSGVVDLLLAGLIFLGLPGTAAWAIGLLVGINMIFGGSALIGMALRARSSLPS